MKKIALLLMITFVMLSCVLCACTSGEELTLYVPDGAPSLAVAKIISDGSVGGRKVNTVISVGEDVVAKCAKGEADMAVLPTNAAVKICSDRDDYLLFTVNVYGILYIMGTQNISTLSQLQGETLYSIGLGNTPEYVFKKICDVQNVSYETNGGVAIKYEADGSTIIPQVLQGKAKFALLGEPAATNLVNKAASQSKTVYRLFDLQQLWQQAVGSNSAGYPQASMIVKKDLLTAKFAKNLLQSLSDNYAFLRENCDTLNDLMKGTGSSSDVNYTVEILDRCNLTVIKAQDAKADIESYLATFSAMQKYLPISDSIYYEAND
ncbi:MAG: hypothetical protein J1F66_03620 [Clostridiales bacterium]|nr:hypothetical protein [Clostridiales bacterium]